jgi:hypothetical protein
MVGGLERVHAYERNACTKRSCYQVNSCPHNILKGWKVKTHKKCTEQASLLERGQ